MEYDRGMYLFANIHNTLSILLGLGYRKTQIVRKLGHLHPEYVACIGSYILSFREGGCVCLDGFLADKSQTETIVGGL